jgi:hypothetical protein
MFHLYGCQHTLLQVYPCPFARASSVLSRTSYLIWEQIDVATNNTILYTKV